MTRTQKHPPSNPSQVIFNDYCHETSSAEALSAAHKIINT